jgi:peptide/nickel transport system ATP-binding protein
LTFACRSDEGFSRAEVPGGKHVTNLLEVEGLTTHIRMRHSTVKAVDGISFAIKAGETVGLVGESGCGKSMAGMSIMRLLPPGGRIVGGSIRLAGREISTLSDRDMRTLRGNEIAMVFQDPMTSLNPTMTIGNQIAESVRIHRGASRKEGMDRAAEVLSLVGMPKPKERLKAFPHELSGGLRQRVVIALALACEPKLLIADEPTTALDVTIQAQILSLLDDLRERLEMGLLLVTHDLGVIAGRADRVMVMYAGRIVESAETRALFHTMRHPYTEALLESIPDIQTDRSHELYSIPGLPPDLSNPPPHCRFAMRCRHAQDRCREEDPQLGGPDPAHLYACFYPVDGPSEKKRELKIRETASARLNRASRADGEPRSFLTLDHVVKEFPITKGMLQRQVGSVKAVSDVSLEIARGETFGLAGESGCGKTTLGRLIVGLDKPDSGSITFDGMEVSSLRGRHLKRARRDMQLVFQDPYASLDPRMRVGATLREPLQNQHLGNRVEQKARIRTLLLEVGLTAEAVHLYPHEFSGGQRQRIGFARALAVEPGLVVADEPVSALDVSIQSQVLNLMKRLQNERELTYVIISHDLSVLRYLADRVGIMYLGKLVETGTSEAVYGRPAHPYTAGLLEAIPQPDPVQESGKKRVAVIGELPSAANPPSGCRFRTRCPRAQTICAEIEPPMSTFDGLGHQAACHFPLVEPFAGGRKPDTKS